MPDTPAKTAFSAASTRLQAWPPWAKAAAYGLANTVLLYLCLAPTKALPKEPFSDKIEHALAWLALTGLGLFLWPGRRARVAGFAFTGNPDPRAFVNASGNFYRKLVLRDRAALAVAVRAGIADHLPASTAGWAAAFDDEEALLRANLAGASTSLAGAGAAIQAGTASALAAVARRQGFDRHILFGTGECFLEA